MIIPFNKIYYTGKEMEYIGDAISRGQVSGDGYYTKLVSTLIEEEFNVPRAFLTTSATHALEMAFMIIGIKPGDEVIMPSFTFSSTANAALLRGAKIVFADIDDKTLNIDIDDVIRKITGRTRAVVPVHYAGISCEMDRLADIARDYGLYIIEDAAHAVNAKYRGKSLGTWGQMGCYSFHGTKNYICGEGGALLINTDDKNLIEAAGIIRQKGTDRDKFLNGEVDKYSWVGTGSSYAPSDILMALLYAQLQVMDSITSKRKAVHDYYSCRLKRFAEEGVIRFTNIPEGCESNYHIFYILLKDEESRDMVIERLKEKGISAYTHFVPLHTSVMGQTLGYREGQLPVTERAGRCLVRLPIYTGMTALEMEYVMDSLEEILRVM